MKKSCLVLAVSILAWISPVFLQAQTTDDEKPFKPYWDNELELSSQNQQGGQSTNSLSYTGTQHFDQAGDLLSAQAMTSRQKVEGVASTTGTLTLTGGLGLGFFSPSLSLGYQTGESALRQWNGSLSMGFQLWDPLSLNLTLGGNAGSHQGPVSQFYPSIQENVRIDTAGLNSSFGPTFVPWDWWSIALALGYEYDITYQLQDIKHPNLKIPVNQADQIGTLTLTLDFTLFKGFILELAPQVGREYFPAGAVYSPQTGGLVFNSAPSSQNFVGGMTSISYSFQ